MDNVWDRSNTKAWRIPAPHIKQKPALDMVIIQLSRQIIAQRSNTLLR